MESTQPLPRKTWPLGGICVVGAFLCMFLTITAYALMLHTVEIDVHGAIVEEFKPYETLIDCYLISGMIAVPLGFVLGVAGLFLYKKERAVAVVPIVVLGFILGLYLYQVIRDFRHVNPPTIETQQE